MPEVIFVHWIVVCIVEIIYPNCSIWIHIYFFFITEVDSKCIRIVALSCSSFLVNPNILEVQFTNVDQTLIVKSLFWWIIQRSEEHTSELQSRGHLVCRLLLAKKKDTYIILDAHTT